MVTGPRRIAQDVLGGTTAFKPSDRRRRPPLTGRPYARQAKRWIRAPGGFDA